MSLKTYFLQVKEVIQETADTVSIYFWHPLNEQIKYKAGQFITIIVPAGENGKKVRRSYSMSTSPHSDTSLGVTVKRVSGGLVSNYLNDRIKVGDFLEVIEPMGNFFLEPDATLQRNFVFIAAGSGITPMMSMIKSILKIETKSTATLFYGNRSEDNIIFASLLEELTNNSDNRLKIHHYLTQPTSTWEGERGRLQSDNILEKLASESINIQDSNYFLCGPHALMENVIAGLTDAQVPFTQIHKENFNTPMEEASESESNDNAEDTRSHRVTVKYDGETYEFDVQPHQTILEAALDLDIDLPYSCQAGMCTACLGTCTSGKVKLDEEDGLTEKELRRGLILTCVAHPLTSDVVIEID